MSVPATRDRSLSPSLKAGSLDGSLRERSNSLPSSPTGTLELSDKNKPKAYRSVEDLTVGLVDPSKATTLSKDEDLGSSFKVRADTPFRKHTRDVSALMGRNRLVATEQKPDDIPADSSHEEAKQADSDAATTATSVSRQNHPAQSEKESTERVKTTQHDELAELEIDQVVSQAALKAAAGDGDNLVKQTSGEVSIDALPTRCNPFDPDTKYNELASYENTAHVREDSLFSRVQTWVVGNPHITVPAATVVTAVLFSYYWGEADPATEN